MNPASINGAIEIQMLDKPIVSFRIFDHPRNWQAMMRWIWEHGNDFAAKSIPLLNSGWLKFLGHCSRRQRCDGSLERQIQCFHKRREKEPIYDRVMNLLNLFPVFEPLLSVDRSSNFQVKTGFKEWHILFKVRASPGFKRTLCLIHIQNSPFRRCLLRIEPGYSEGVVFVRSFDRLIKIFPMNRGYRVWRAFIEFIWNLGNQHHISTSERQGNYP